MDDTNATVPDWFVKCYDSGYFGIGLVVLGLVAVVLVGIACRLYFQTRKMQRLMSGHEKTKNKSIMKTILHYLLTILLFSLTTLPVRAATADEEPFKITNGGGVNCTYKGDTTLLTISGNGNLTITGKGKPANCGIKITGGNSKVSLTLKDLHIKTDNPLTLEAGLANDEYQLMALEGVNILESDAATPQPGMLLNGKMRISSGGSLTVKGSPGGGAGVKCNRHNLTIENAVFRVEGGVAAPGMDCSGNLKPLTLDNNAFVIAIGGKGAFSSINQSRDSLNQVNGLLILGRVANGDTINQEYAELVGNMALGIDAEIPAWARITVGNGQAFTIADGVTFTNKGDIYNHGVISSNRVRGNLPEHFVTFESNYRNAGSSIGVYITHNSIAPDTIFTRTDYTFKGWYDAPDGGTEVTVVTYPQTLYAYWTKTNPDTVPEPEPAPAPVYYTVTLPAVEGAVTKPAAGSYKVESGRTFYFRLMLDTAYSLSQPVVTTSRGETVTPRDFDGAYIVRAVDMDMKIFIDGLVKNSDLVANKPIRGSVETPEVWAEHSYLCIRMPDNAPAVPGCIVTPGGRLVSSFRSVQGLSRRQLPTGIYIVQVGNTVRKVFVR